jgi:hypothetical protein
MGPRYGSRRSPRSRWSLGAALVSIGLGIAASVTGQSAVPASPRAAQPERPTVATHAFTVAPGIVEMEAGFLQQRPESASNQFGVPVVFKIGLGSRLQLDVAPGWMRNANGGDAQSGFTDLTVGVKWRLVDRAPVLGAFAFQPTVSLPTGSVERGTGAGTTSLNLLFVSSRNVHGVALDINAGVSLRGGDGSSAPTTSTLWSVSTGIPVAGRLGWAAEVYGYPGTSGPAGAAPVVAFLTGPIVGLTDSVVVDAGMIFNITGLGTAVYGLGVNSIYGGVTWNMGRLWTPRGRPVR